MKLFLLLIAALFVTANLSCKRPSDVVLPKTDPNPKKAIQGDDVTAKEDESKSKRQITIPPPSSQVLKKALTGTVRLGSDEFDGSGVIIHRDEKSLYVLTVAHAVREQITRVEIFDGKETPIVEMNQVKVLSQQARADLALIQVPISDEIETTAIRLAKNDKSIDQTAFGYSVGCGGGKPPSTHRERILGADSIKINLESGSAIRHMWRTELPQEQGRSGGPLLDVNGDLLGIALGRFSDNGYYAHLQEISDYLIDSGLETLVTYSLPSHN